MPDEKAVCQKLLRTAWLQSLLLEHTIECVANLCLEYVLPCLVDVGCLSLSPWHCAENFLSALALAIPRTRVHTLHVSTWQYPATSMAQLVQNQSFRTILTRSSINTLRLSCDSIDKRAVRNLERNAHAWLVISK